MRNVLQEKVEWRSRMGGAARLDLTEKASIEQRLKEGGSLQDTEDLKGHVISTHSIIICLYEVQVIG